ncbi:hypothetical protein PRIC1_010952 [Phytophthora ramorum]
MALLPIYIVHQPVKQRCGPVRFQFLLEAVQDLADSIDKLQGRLLVLRGDAEEVLRAVLPAWGITDLFFEAGVMPYARARRARAGDCSGFGCHGRDVLWGDAIRPARDHPTQ